MSKFDRYLLAQLLALFGFFSLVLVAVYWVNRAVKLFDQLIGDGQSALVFLEFSILTLPNVIRLVLPISAFAACLYAINRLMQESELVVMQATGFSAFRLARPVVFFGIAVLAMQLVLTNILVPLSQSRLSARSAEVSENVTARFLNEGRFMHPSDGITIYIREITPLGELNDLFLSDERNPDDRLVYTAEKALLVRGETGPKLVMLDGVTQRLTQADRRIALTRFDTFTLDLSEVVKAGGGLRVSAGELTTPELLVASEATQKETGATRAELLEEGHSRFATSLLALAAPLLGFSAMMLGGYSRFGMVKQIALAVVLLIVLQSLSTMATSTASRNETAFALVYLPPLIGMAAAAALLWLAQQPRRRKTVAEGGA